MPNPSQTLSSAPSNATSDRCDGRVALVTAAAGGGVGSAVARRLAARGCKVVVTDQHEKRLAAFVAELRVAFPDAQIQAYPLEVSDRARTDVVIDEVARTLGPVRILVNNAALDILGTLFDYDPSDWDRTVAVNLSAPWYFTRRVMPGMREAGGGVVVNIGSIADQLGGSGFEGAYAVTKGALAALSRAISRDGAAYGIRAVTVSPGPIIDTRVVQSNLEVLDHPDLKSLTGSYPTSEEIAGLVDFLVSDAASHVIGETINVNAGAHMSP